MPPVGSRAVAFEPFLGEPAGLPTVARLDRYAEHFFGDCLDVVSVEAVLLD